MNDFVKNPIGSEAYGKIIASVIRVIVMMVISSNISAKEPTKGYRWFLDLGSEARFEKKYSNDRDIVYSNTGITTTHGYQFGRNFFVGGGFGIDVVTSNYDWFSLGLSLPVFASGRADWKIWKLPLFADLRVGTFIKANANNVFINPSVGYHCSSGRKVSLNIGVGLSVHYANKTYREHGKLMPSVKIGIDFN